MKLLLAEVEKIADLVRKMKAGEIADKNEQEKAAERLRRWADPRTSFLVLRGEMIKDKLGESDDDQAVREKVDKIVADALGVIRRSGLIETKSEKTGKEAKAERQDAETNDLLVAEYLKPIAFSMRTMSFEDCEKLRDELKTAEEIRRRINALDEKTVRKLSPKAKRNASGEWIGKTVMATRILDTTGKKGGGSPVPQFWYEICTQENSYYAFAEGMKSLNVPEDRYDASELRNRLWDKFCQFKAGYKYRQRQE